MKDDARIGTVLDGRYRIVEPLSKGGMGIIYRAERIPVGRPVAIKFLHALFASHPEARVRFERETRALSKLAHPHCVSIVVAAVDCDSPAANQAVRVTLKLCSPTWLTQPPTT